MLMHINSSQHLAQNLSLSTLAFCSLKYFLELLHRIAHEFAFRCYIISISNVILYHFHKFGYGHSITGHRRNHIGNKN